MPLRCQNKFSYHKYDGGIDCVRCGARMGGYARGGLITNQFRTRKPFRDGRVHVVKNMCATCIFRDGNLMRLTPGRCEEMVKVATALQSAIICHSTLDGKQSVCFGFFRLHPTQPLELAERLGLIKFTEPEDL